MKRRDVLKLTAAAPASVLAHAATQSPPAAAWKPLLFDDHQNQTVVALCDLIIPATGTPGAKAALVNRHLDRLLHDGPVENQQRFLEGLAWLDGFAIRGHGHPFARCTTAQQTAMLEALEAGVEDGVGPGQRFFRIAKMLIASTYYATEIGVKELNKDGRVPSGFGCSHGGHV